ncbi:hypothetical protein MOQ72_32170 [Saccharopolyspora sp. K220]|uniref:hypothetical protein n=1 Tax=Saccharopolyspora soli TaxID=2926618 RepID=UPI001F55EF80|nr:hypothetical protein [Saccharopolyspora soli]MCI2422099.1 hypothetical protein [Saccharopolyspora soli]
MCLVVAVLSTAVITASQIAPMLPGKPGYTSVPNACESVSDTSLQRAFGDRLPTVTERDHDASERQQNSQCVWRTEGSISQIGTGRFGRLDTHLTTMFDEDGYPNVATVDDALRRLAHQPHATHRAVLGAHAVVAHDDQKVRLTAFRANLIVAVTYSAVHVDLGNVQETPLPATELDAVAHQIAADVLATAGQPHA